MFKKTADHSAFAEAKVYARSTREATNSGFYDPMNPDRTFDSMDTRSYIIERNNEKIRALRDSELCDVDAPVTESKEVTAYDGFEHGVRNAVNARIISRYQKLLPA